MKGVSVSFADLFKEKGIQASDKSSVDKQTTMKDGADYCGAPYNFVPISRKVYDYQKNGHAMPSQQLDGEERYSGFVQYKIKALTDIANDDGEDKNKTVHVYKDKNGNPAIAGSSLRGLVRANAQILSMSSFDPDIADDYLMFRDMAKKASPLKERYKKILDSTQKSINNSHMTVNAAVHAGYLVNKGEDDYHFFGTVPGGMMKEMNYYVVSERYINEHLDSFAYLYTTGEGGFNQPLQYRKGTVFVKKGQSYDCSRKSDFNGAQGGSYVPFYKKIRFDISVDQKDPGVKRIRGIYSPDGRDGEYKGYLVGTGAMQRKKALYVIPEPDMKNEIGTEEVKEVRGSDQEDLIRTERDVIKKAIASFRVDYNRKKNTLRKEVRNYYDLPQAGADPKPVFYILDGGRFYFGYTPNLRLFFDHSVKEGLVQETAELDYNKAVFGFASDKAGLKGRVSFTDAAAEKKITETRTFQYVLSEPKPTSYWDYLKTGEKVYTYNDDDFQLGGTKQYWIHKAEKEPVFANDNVNVRSSFTALPKGSLLEGKVRFHDLTKDELGLLLWSIELNPETKQNIGKAKAYGFGAFQISINALQLLDVEKAYSLESFSLFPYQEALDRKTEFEEAFKQLIVNWYYQGKKSGGKKKAGKAPTADNIGPVRIFMEMKMLTPPEKDIRYMTLPEYQNRTSHLPSADELSKRWGNTTK